MPRSVVRRCGETVGSCSWRLTGPRRPGRGWAASATANRQPTAPGIRSWTDGASSPLQRESTSSSSSAARWAA
jgi:hypothetical protein